MKEARIVQGSHFGVCTRPTDGTWLRTQLINISLYFVLLLVIVWMIETSIHDIPRWTVFAFVLFLWSPINYESHSWGIMTVSHVWILAALLGNYFVFEGHQRWRALFSGAFFLFVAAYSVCGGAHHDRRHVGVLLGIQAGTDSDRIVVRS